MTVYGMVFALIALCIYFSVATVRDVSPDGADGAISIARQLNTQGYGSNTLLVVYGTGNQDKLFASTLQEILRRSGSAVIMINGSPPEIRDRIQHLLTGATSKTIIAATKSMSDLPIWDAIAKDVPSSKFSLVSPSSARSSVFLSTNNIRNIADQISVIAIIAVGMTLVILTGGIDLSVGSMIALSAVLCAWFIQRWGGKSITPTTAMSASLLTALISAGFGTMTGFIITWFKVPPFIVTLASMQIAGGLAFQASRGQTLYDIPDWFSVLGRGNYLSVPYSVILMFIIYLLAHFILSKSVIGRTVYAVGGNTESSRLSGISIPRTIIFVYFVSGLMAGIGGIITTSQLKAGAPTYGSMYEMYAIAAVVVGGASLTGGQGNVFGTLIGAFIIAVIKNGMNLMDVEPYMQKVLLGVVILLAVLGDKLRNQYANRSH